MYKIWARGSVDISAKKKQAISLDFINPKDFIKPRDFHNSKDNQNTAKLLMKLISEEVARQIYHKKNNYDISITSDKKEEGRNLS